MFWGRFFSLRFNSMSFAVCNLRLANSINVTLCNRLFRLYKIGRWPWINVIRLDEATLWPFFVSVSSCRSRCNRVRVSLLRNSLLQRRYIFVRAFTQRPASLWDLQKQQQTHNEGRRPPPTRTTKLVTDMTSRVNRGLCVDPPSRSLLWTQRILNLHFFLNRRPVNLPQGRHRSFFQSESRNSWNIRTDESSNRYVN